MPRDAIDIVREYLRYDGESRSNAVTALAAIGTRESIAEVIEVALSSMDFGAAGRAEMELARLEGENAKFATAEVEKALDDPSKEGRAYELLRKLRVLATPRGTWSQRATRVLKYGGKKRFDVGARLKLLAPGIVGAVVGLAALGVVAGLAVQFWPGVSDYWLFIVTPFLSALLFVVLGTFGATPLQMHYDRRAALFVSLVAAFAGGSVATSVLILFAAMSEPPADLRGLLVTALGGGACAAAARAAVLPFVGRRIGPFRLFASAVGGAAAVLVLTIWLMSFGLTRGLASTIWILLVPSAFGLAAAFAKIDEEEYAASRPGGWAFAGGVVILGILVALSGAVVWPGLEEVRLAHDGAAFAVPSRLPVSDLRNEMSIRLPLHIGNQGTIVTITGHSVDGSRVAVRGWSGGFLGGSDVHDLAVPPGEYILRVTEFSGWSQIFDLLADRFRRLLDGRRVLGTATIQIAIQSVR
jgi:hypothetical protein